MREASRLLALTAIGLTIAFSSPVSAQSGGPQSGGSKGDPAHALAEKFSAEADRPAKEAAAKREAQRRAEEAEMLATAKAEAEARREALEQSRAAALLAEQHRIAEEKRMAEAKASEARRIAEEQRAAEARRVAEAKAADDARKAAEAARIAEQKAAEAKVAEAKAAEAKAVEERHIAELKAAEDQRRAAAEAKAAEDRRIAEAKALEENRLKAEAARLAKQKQDEAHRIADAKRAEEHRRQAEVEAETQARARTQAQAQAMAAEREAEAQRVAERLREAHARRANANAGNSNQTAASAPQPLQPPAGLGGPAQAPPVSQPWNVWTTPAQANRSGPARVTAARVTVLLLMEPGNRGIRRHNKTADPLLCNGGGCFVSNGSEAAATFMPGRRALGADRTFGERAGACSQSLGCVFRDVDLGTLPVSVQPIDMRVMHHDRREARTIDTPADCRALAGRLMCRRTIQSSDYTMWVVPEDLARSIGPAALERALAEGLPDSEQAALPPPALPYPWRR